MIIDISKITWYGENAIEYELGTILNIAKEPEYLTNLQPLYKKSASGSMMRYTFSFMWSDGFIIKGTIVEDGKKDRVFESLVSRVKSKEYAKVLFETLISKHAKKRDREGWSETMEDDEEKIDAPQLLHRWDKEKNRQGPWLASPKLDGIRGTWWKWPEVLYSRRRSAIHKPHLVEQLKDLGIAADGELWKQGYDWEDISGAVARDTDSAGDKLLQADIEFHIFDRTDMLDAPYVDRLASLTEIDWDKYPSLFYVPSIYCETEDQVQDFFEKCLLHKYEGIVARKLTAMYAFNERSHDVLKIKPVFSREFPLVSVTYDEDPKFGRMISYLLMTDNGKTFKATPSRSKEDRAEAYKIIQDQPLPKSCVVTAEYRDVYQSGKPKFAVAKGVRQPFDIGVEL